MQPLTYPFLTGSGPCTWKLVQHAGAEHVSLRCPRCGKRAVLIPALVDEHGRVPGIAKCPHDPCVWEGRVVLLGWSLRSW